MNCTVYELYLNRAAILNILQQLLTLCLIQGKAQTFPAREEGGLNGNECAGAWLSWGSGLGGTQHGIKLSSDNSQNISKERILVKTETTSLKPDFSTKG